MSAFRLPLPRFASLLLLGALGAFGAFAGAAHAGEITIYEHADFAGRSVALREATPSLSRFGFNDKSSSIVIRSGRWEVCSDDDFRGYCVMLERGDYPRLDRRLNDQISSVREIGGYGDEQRRRHRDERAQGPEYGGYGGGYRGDGGDAASRYEAEAGPRDERNAAVGVVLFSEPGLRGRSLVVAGDIVTLADAGFNDAAASLVIQRGYWELCSDRDFHGQCRVLGPGEYRNLEPGLFRAISSLRRVR